MNCIERVEITGFWGERRVSLDLHDDLNFLIGPNGSGKTTVINLISAALLGDINTLYATQFEKIVIRLKTMDSANKPVIEVNKTVNKRMGNFELIYQIRTQSGGKETYGVEGPYDERLYKVSKHPSLRRRYAETGKELHSILAELVEVNWLSVHRSRLEIDARPGRGESYESSVDQKLNEISRAFSRYFSLLASKSEEESKNFQEYVVRSLLLLDRELTIEEAYGQVSAESYDSATLFDILTELGFNSNDAKKNANDYFERLEAAKKIQLKKGIFDIKEVFMLFDAHRVNNIIRRWREFQDKSRNIFEPRTTFEKIINEHFVGKRIRFDERNLPKVSLASNTDVSVDMLSSGEKQLFILLGETLLQENRAVIFISDEPELSLHVKWQSTLFENIRSLNHSCQVISATHSPDIIGPFGDRVIEMNKHISNV